MEKIKEILLESLNDGIARNRWDCLAVAVGICTAYELDAVPQLLPRYIINKIQPWLIPGLPF